MKFICSNLRRAMAGRWFCVAIFTSSALLWLSIGPETWYFFDGLLDKNTPDWTSFLQNALIGQTGQLLMPALSALPYSAEAFREIRNGIFRPVLFRVGYRNYLIGQTVACFVSGAMVQLGAMAILCVFLSVAVVVTGNVPISLSYISAIAFLLLGRMVCGGGWALSGCIAALITSTASAAMIAPLCMNYALTMIATRFFSQMRLLNPGTWQSAPMGALLLAALALLTITGAVLYREVKKHV